ncbi:putative ABC transport system permease protein [Actinocorallia herbida]|uniref:Putative ABC transport system permease protein n=1 Tax=Actinocorallia herbida TaxID=58109 RepID=A0A3N1D651_9ACTN|nr:ABC transporter permease [Actinocorallia herbida]ROO89015.1 putative ABC transport system permease protein [Actinocorallia herbida]
MFLALRELRFARARFGLMGAVVALIAALMVLLSGLADGLVDDGVSGLKRLPVTSFAFESGVQHDAAFTRSVVDTADAATWTGRTGVTAAAPFGLSLANTESDRGVELDLALFGVEAGSFLAPAAARGTGLGSPDGIVVSPTALADGLALGDTVTVDRIGTRLKVVGVLDAQHTFGHVDVAYLPLRVWQEVHAGLRPGENASPRVYEQATAIAVRGEGADLAAADQAAGTESLTLKESFDASPGYRAETSTLLLIEVFLYAISALVVGAFFTVLTIQRKPEIAVMRAMGAPTGHLLRDALAQALILLLAFVALGVAVGVGLGAFMDGGGVPFRLAAGSVAGAAALLVALGTAGALLAVLRIASVDPLTALGGAR